LLFKEYFQFLNRLYLWYLQTFPQKDSTFDNTYLYYKWTILVNSLQLIYKHGICFARPQAFQQTEIGNVGVMKILYLDGLVG